MSKKYSNKGYHARTAVQPQKDNTNTIITWVTVGLCLAVVAAIAIAIMVATGTFEPTVEPAIVDMEEVKSEINSFGVLDFAETDQVTEYVKITVKGYGDIIIRLRPDVAPKTVENFQKLVKDGHYSDKIFHRVIQNFMIQGGGMCEKDACYTNNGSEHKVDSIKGEFTSNGHTNNLKHVRGVISMARTNAPDSASNQFFICDATSSHLDGQYAAFGYVLAGMATVDKIAAVETSADSSTQNKPLEDIVIEKVVFVNPLK